MSFGTDTPAAAGMSSLYGSAGESFGAGMTESVPTGQPEQGGTMLHKIMDAIASDPESMKFMSEMSGHSSRLASTFRKATPEQQQMLNHHVEQQIRRMMQKEQQAEMAKKMNTPYMGDIPPEVAMDLMRALGFSAERGSGGNPYFGPVGPVGR